MKNLFDIHWKEIEQSAEKDNVTLRKTSRFLIKIYTLNKLQTEGNTARESISSETLFQ